MSFLRKALKNGRVNYGTNITEDQFTGGGAGDNYTIISDDGYRHPPFNPKVPGVIPPKQPAGIESLVNTYEPPTNLQEQARQQNYRNSQTALSAQDLANQQANSFASLLGMTPPDDDPPDDPPPDDRPPPPPPPPPDDPPPDYPPYVPPDYPPYDPPFKPPYTPPYTPPFDPPFDPPYVPPGDRGRPVDPPMFPPGFEAPIIMPPPPFDPPRFEEPPMMMAPPGFEQLPPMAPPSFEQLPGSRSGIESFDVRDLLRGNRK